MKNLQRDYFEKRVINETTYNRRMEAYKLRKAEVEEALAVLETKLAKKSKLEGLQMGLKSKIKKLIFSKLKKMS